MTKHMDITGGSSRGITFGGRGGVPKYIGAEAEVKRVEGGVLIRLRDYKGTTQEIVYECIQDIAFNEDTSMTIELPDGRTFTSGPLKGAKGEKGDKGDGVPMYFATTAEWAERTDLISEKDALYVWTDYKEVDGEYIAGMKVGDGLAYVVDLPFMDAQFQAHASNTDIHITNEERAFWNAKNRGMVIGENLLLTDL